MKVSLIQYTGKDVFMGWSPSGAPLIDRRGETAVNTLIFTKSTRLQMSPGLMSEIEAWSWDKKMEEVEYIANTIPSSWEFVDYIFMIEGVSRGFTHQFVRSRLFSFAQQTMRILDVSEGPGWDYYVGPSIAKNEGLLANYNATMQHIARAYKWLIRDGASIEDARGVLPTNIITNIVGKCNMRTFVELVHKRSSSRVQGEYRDVLLQMKEQILAVHPWMALFIDRTADRAADELQEMIAKVSGVDTGASLAETKNKMIKLLDQIRKVM